jgi:hypothetical protein
MDRAIEYRKTAAASLQMAQRCGEPEQKARWLRIRDRWTTLAIEVENDAAGFAALNDINVDTATINIGTSRASIDISTIGRLLHEMRSAFSKQSD